MLYWYILPGLPILNIHENQLVIFTNLTSINITSHSKVLYWTFTFRCFVQPSVTGSTVETEFLCRLTHVVLANFTSVRVRAFTLEFVDFVIANS